MKLICLLTLLIIAPLSLAEEVAIPLGSQGISGLDLPKKGLTMEQVESEHGAAKVKHAVPRLQPLSWRVTKREA